MLSDENPQWEMKSPQTLGGSPISLHLYFVVRQLRERRSGVVRPPQVAEGYVLGGMPERLPTLVINPEEVATGTHFDV